MLSDGFWHSHFGASPKIVGSSIDLNGTDYTVTGILPSEFSFYGIQRDIYVPVGQWNDPSFLDRRVDVSSHAVGRLKPGVTLAQARADMDAIAHHLALAYPEADKGVGISLLSMKEDMVGDVQPVLLVLLAAVAFLLLISCANVASLLLARSMSRSGEFALRASLGASRSRIIRQLLTESLLLAGLGGILGFLLAFFGTKAVLTAPARLASAGRRSFHRRPRAAVYPRRVFAGRNHLRPRTRAQVLACQSATGAAAKQPWSGRRAPSPARALCRG